MNRLVGRRCFGPAIAIAFATATLSAAAPGCKTSTPTPYDEDGGGTTTTTATLTIAFAGTGSGTVTIASDETASGTNDGGSATCSVACTEEYPTTATVNLTTTAADDSIFDGWTPGSCGNPLSMAASVTCTATFKLLELPEGGATD